MIAWSPWSHTWSCKQFGDNYHHRFAGVPTSQFLVHSLRKAWYWQIKPQDLNFCAPPKSFSNTHETHRQRQFFPRESFPPSAPFFDFVKHPQKWLFEFLSSKLFLCLPLTRKCLLGVGRVRVHRGQLLLNAWAMPDFATLKPINQHLDRCACIRCYPSMNSVHLEEFESDDVSVKCQVFLSRVSNVKFKFGRREYHC